MKLSKKWLSDYVKIEGVSPREFAEAMTMSGSKVEGYELPHEKMSGIVIGKLLEFAPIAGDEKHFLCKTDIGNGKILQQVTGAPNLVKGGYVAVAAPGAVLPNGKAIGTTEFNGMKSEGMMCSLAELGVSLHDFPYSVDYGIFFLEEENIGDAQLGMDAASLLGLDDIITDFEITSNRPDCLSVLGLAREVSATFAVPFQMHKPVVKGKNGHIGDFVKVTVQNPELCPRYVARAVTNIKIGPSPRFIRERLRAAGMRAINNIVDITNYVMLEYGQPLHAFDRREIKSGEIVVRKAGDDKKFTTLDGTERSLSTNMLMICDSTTPIGVAGVMGGLESEVRPDTSTVIFESATFHGASIRRTARELGLRTEASGRYEKGLNTQQTMDAVNRACELVELCGAGDVVDGVIDVDNSGYKQTVLPLEVEKINALCGTAFTGDEMKKILLSLGFEMDGEDIKVPAARGDVTHTVDIAEEVIRIYGYNNIPSTLFSGATAQGAFSPKQQFENRMAEAMLGYGFSEIVTYTFISPKFYDKLCLPANAPERNSIVILNPLGEDTSIMRRTSVSSMLNVLSLNYNNRNAKASLYENAKIFIKSEQEDQLPNEREILTLGTYGSGDFFFLKGVVTALCHSLHIKEQDYETERENHTFHPGRCANIYIGETKVGVIGEIHPKVLANFEIDVPTIVATLDMEILRDNVKSAPLYVPLPRFPAVARDIAVVCKSDLEVSKIAKAIRGVCGELLETCELFDVYRGEHIEVGKKSVAYSLSLRDKSATLKEEQITELMTKVLKALEMLGCVLRA